QKAIDAVNYLLSLYPDDDWMVTAGMSSPYFDEESWLKSLMDSKNLNVDFLTRLSYLLTMENKIEVLQGILLESIKVKNEQISIPIIKGITRGWRERDENPEINREELPIIQGFLFSEGEASKVWRDFIKTIKVPLEKSQKHFINILENENNDALKRASAISLILNHGDPGEKVKSYLDPRQPLPVQVASVEWLSEYADSDDSFNEYLMVNWEKLSSPVRNRAVDLMIGSEERSKLLLTAIESEKIDKSIVGWRRSVRLMNSKDEDIKERARALFDGSDADGENILANYGDINTSSGDAALGKTVFMDYCSTCHKIGDALGTDYGPDLLSIKNQAKSAILKHILQPGLSLADGYELWDISMNDGSQMQGIISNEDEKTMRLLVAPGNEVRINREDIGSIKVLDTSGMPNGLGNSIGKEDMEDLLEFIKEYRRE
ncbi:MAG: c-type cytochrome, partial [Cyclobacteriaceae bacterium]|nr:c-type cytochrome [Cyclobacteriaceae bacterium]